MTLSRDVVRGQTIVPSVKKSYARIPHILDLPNLIHIQVDSYRWFQREGLRELFDEISPIQDFTGTRLELRFGEYSFGEPKYSEWECRERDMTYSAPLRVNVQLVVKETGEVKEQELFMGDFPLMTPNGTFIINGAERVVVSQLVRSPGVYFTLETDPTSGRDLCYAKLIPNRGAWLEFETSNKDVVSVKVDRKRKIPITTLLRAMDQDEEETDETKLGINERLIALFDDVDTHPDHQYIRSTLEKEPCQNKQEALLEFYRRLRPGDPPTLENARGLITSLFFNPRRYDLGAWVATSSTSASTFRWTGTTRVLGPADLRAIAREMIRMNNGLGQPDDIDHLGNRRVRAVGELIQNQFRIGLLRMERVVRERMTITDPDQATPSALINIRPVVAAMKEFFGGSQLSQFMDQTNPLAELTHKRRLSALGPGGLSRDRAGFDVRDVHHSHYGRICPIETPEGPNIGLIGSLATYGRINEYGFIETPYRRVVRELWSDAPGLVGRFLRQDVVEDGTVVAAAGTTVTPDLAEKLRALPHQMVAVRPFVSDEIVYLSADRRNATSSPRPTPSWTRPTTSWRRRSRSRFGEHFMMEPPEHVDFMDVSPKQIVSVATSLIPFLEHDDANRALMGSNMQRQAVPLLRPEMPLVATGMEAQAARDSGQVILAEDDGVVAALQRRRHHAFATTPAKRRSYPLMKFVRSNQGTCINQRPIVNNGQRVSKGEPLADSSSTDQGELALGQSVLCAFMSWEGYNFEDAIVISETRRQRRQVQLHPHREARDGGARHQAGSGGDHARHPQRGRGEPARPGRGRHHPHRRRGAGPATSWWARSRPRARRSSPPRRSSCAPSSARRRAR